ncbi:glycosyltransferase family 39 protein [Leptolyngbya sp. AN03gr2]|uniref:glycosyltransferase family 39 protein n=1 Tax=unclassified Leptolyngbya TaxID=2650499 RepID=UPI003D3123A3
MAFNPQEEQGPQKILWIAEESISSTFKQIIKFVAICLVVIGILFRFTNLDLKPYWLDEAFTSFRLSGYSNAAVMQQIGNRVIPVRELQKYQQPAPENTSFHTIEQLATQEPQLTPLYFVLLRAWTQSFGSSIATIRSLSAIFSVLAFPCLYWLCLELFESRQIAWMSIAVMSVSPLHLLYAKEARPTSLWLLTLLLSSALLLRALRTQTKLNWLWYGLSIAVGLYGHLFTTFVSIAHAVYVLLQERFRLSKNLISFGIASIAGWLFFVPWIWFGLVTHHPSMAGQSLPMPLPALIRSLLRSVSLVFVDFSLDERSPRLYFLMFLAVFLSVLVFVGLVLFFFYRSAPKSPKQFVFAMIAVPYVLLLGSDLAFGAARSGAARYLILAYVGIQLATAYIFTTRIADDSARFRKVWIGLMGFILSIGLMSCGLMTTSEFWWNKADANSERQLASIVNRSTKPIVITDDYFVKLLSFSHSLAPDVRVQVLSNAAPNIPQGFSDVFLYRPSESLQKALTANHRLQPIEPPLLWKLQQP